MHCTICPSRHQKTSSGEERLRMCIAVKKKLQLYYWKDREFHEMQVKLNMIHAVPALFSKPMAYLVI